MKITKSQLRQIIKEEVSRLQKKTVLENRKKEIRRELRILAEGEEVNKRKMIVLVGPPSVGKSTWIKSNFPDAYIINRDDIVESVASSYGWTYDDMFATPPSDAKVGDSDEKYGNVVESPDWMTWSDTVFDKVFEANGKVQNLMNSRVSGAHPSGKNVVVDMTNMNSNSRKGAMKAIEGNEVEYHKIAVDFKFEGAEDVIKNMAQKRAEAAQRMGKSKTIPPSAFDRMFSSYEKPSTSEGFDEIVSVDNIQNLKNALQDSEKDKENVNESVRQAIREGFKDMFARKEKENNKVNVYGDFENTVKEWLKNQSWLDYSENTINGNEKSYGYITNETLGNNNTNLNGLQKFVSEKLKSLPVKNGNKIEVKVSGGGHYGEQINFTISLRNGSGDVVGFMEGIFEADDFIDN